MSGTVPARWILRPALLALLAPAVFASSPKTPLTIEAKGTISPVGREVGVQVTVRSLEPVDEAWLSVALPEADSLVLPASLRSAEVGAPERDPIERTVRRHFRVDAKDSPGIGFSVTPASPGDHRIDVQVTSPRPNGDVWGDGWSYFYNDDGKELREGYRILDKISTAPATEAVPGAIAEAPRAPITPVSTALPESPAAAAPREVSPTGLVTVSGRWMGYNQADSYIPAYEQLTELVDGSNAHLAWTYTDSSGYFTFPAVTNPGTVSVKLMAETYYNRSGGTDHIWVRNAGGTIHAVQTATRNPADGSYNIGEWNVPNGGSNEKGFWAFRAMQETWRYLYLLNTSYYPGSLGCVWYSGSTDGTYFSTSGDQLIHLKDNDPAGPDVTAHESGHNVMYNVYGSYFPFNDCASPHYITSGTALNCGWTEGWGDFVSLAVYNDPTYTDVANSFSVEMETPTRGTSGWGSGSTVEGRVAGLLWDVIDSANEGSDYFTDSATLLWNTIYNVNTDSFCPFWDATRNYSIKRNRDNTLYQNTADSCTNCFDDSYENDDSCGTAASITVNGGAQTMSHCSDEDWRYVDPGLDWTYTFQTDALGRDGDTVLSLYDSVCSVLVASTPTSDDIGTGTWTKASRLDWTSDRTSRVHLRIQEYNSAYAAGRSYDLAVSRVCNNPATPGSLSPSNGGTLCSGTTASLSWTGSGRTYDVVVDGVTTCSGTTSTGCTTGTLGVGSHTWYVTARNACGGAATTSTYSFYLSGNPAISGTTAADASSTADTGVNLSWTTTSAWNDNGYNSAGRKIEVLRDGNIIATLASTATSYNDNTGANNVYYSYTVKFYNGCNKTITYSSQSAQDQVSSPPGEASKAGSQLRVTKASGTSVTVTFTAGGCSTNTAAYWGVTTGNMTGYSWSGTACSLGTGGSATFNPGTAASSGFLYFVLVAQNASVEGSYGTSSTGVQIPESTISSACNLSQTLSGNCP